MLNNPNSGRLMDSPHHPALQISLASPWSAVSSARTKWRPMVPPTARYPWFYAVIPCKHDGISISIVRSLFRERRASHRTGPSSGIPTAHSCLISAAFKVYGELFQFLWFCGCWWIMFGANMMCKIGRNRWKCNKTHTGGYCKHSEQLEVGFDGWGTDSGAATVSLRAKWYVNERFALKIFLDLTLVASIIVLWRV